MDEALERTLKHFSHLHASKRPAAAGDKTLAPRKKRA